uniref:Cytochrome c oxidase subunit 3 n=1 Tax=Salix viminalis TaxID=40686 RepID=A0A6N2KSW2_SALVM
MYMHSFQGGATLLSLGLLFILYTMFVWWRDVLRESTLEGHHTKVVQLGLRYGFILFIVSEVMFFFAFFWAFFHSSLAPTVEIGGIWPPKGIGVLDPWEIPFLNTLILLSSGAAVTWAHHAILAGKEKRAVYALAATVLLALVFTGFQGMEYYQAPFTISDSIMVLLFLAMFMFSMYSFDICGIRQSGHDKSIHVGLKQLHGLAFCRRGLNPGFTSLELPPCNTEKRKSEKSMWKKRSCSDSRLFIDRRDSVYSRFD